MGNKINSDESLVIQEQILNLLHTFKDFEANVKTMSENIHKSLNDIIEKMILCSPNDFIPLSVAKYYHRLLSTARGNLNNQNIFKHIVDDEVKEVEGKF